MWKCNRGNSAWKERLVSCVKCHKGTAGPAIHWRLCVCFSFQYFAKSTEQPLEFERKFNSKQMTAVYLRDCALLFSDRMFLNLLRCCCFLLFCMPLLMSQRAHNSVCLLTGRSLFTGRFSAALIGPLINTCSKCDSNSTKPKRRTSHREWQMSVSLQEDGHTTQWI